MGLVGIALLVIAIIAVVVIAAILIYNALKPPDDPLANQPGHDHTHGGADGCSACQAAQSALRARYPEKCIIKFRPHASWKGEYGFDWIREGDTSFSGDIPYKDTVGKYGDDYATDKAKAVFTNEEARYISLCKGYYDPVTPSAWKKNDKGKPYDYFVPCISLYPEKQCKGNSKKCEAKLTLQIEVKDKEPEILRIDYDKKLFQFSAQEVTPKSIGSKGTMDLTIKCLEEFDKDQFITIYPYKKGNDGPVGKLRVLKNNADSRTSANIIFVRVVTKINKTIQTGQMADKKELLEKYFHQSLTSLNSKEVTLNLATKSDLQHDSAMNKSWKLKLPKSANNGISTRLADGTKIHSFLEKRFNKENPGLDSSFKIFIFEENGGYYHKGKYNGLDGQAAGLGTAEGNKSRSVIVFKNPAQSTTPHELLHSMGLYHTFDNDGAYVYKIGETDNIMDYSDLYAYSSPPKEQICTWRWQWNAIRPMLEKE